MGCPREGKERKMTLPPEGIKPGGNFPWAEYVKATLCDERYQGEERGPETTFRIESPP